MKRLGVGLSDQVICYDTSAWQFFGFRAAWMFNAMGHNNVQVLEGGLPQWLKENRQIESWENVTEADYSYKLDSDKI